MPLIGFICPDGEKILIKDCLKEGGCRLKDRCASRTYLQMASQQRGRTWKCTSCSHDTYIPEKEVKGDQYRELNKRDVS